MPDHILLFCTSSFASLHAASLSSTLLRPLCLCPGEKWSDRAFPPTDASLGAALAGRGYEWRRLSEIFHRSGFVSFAFVDDDARLGANRGLCYRFDPNIDFAPRRASTGVAHGESARAVPFVERAKRIARAVLELGSDASALDGLVWKEGAEFVANALRATVAAQPIRFKSFGSDTFGEMDESIPLGQPRIVVHLELVFEQTCHMFEPPAAVEGSVVGGGFNKAGSRTPAVKGRAPHATRRRAMGTAPDGTRILEPRRLGTAPDGSRVREPMLPLTPEVAPESALESAGRLAPLVEPGDINQGELGDCFLLCALSILSTHPTLLFDMFPRIPAELVAAPPSPPAAVGSPQHAHRVIALARKELSNARLAPHEVAMIEATMTRAHECMTPPATPPPLRERDRGDRGNAESVSDTATKVAPPPSLSSGAGRGSADATRVMQQFCPEGVYAIRFWIAALCEWRIVLVDDFVPFDPKTSFLAFARPALHTGEIWVALVEKACVPAHCLLFCLP